MISAVIITKNEAKNISRCLDSLSWVDEIIIVDSGSTDETINISASYKCKIIKTAWLGFGETKNLGVSSALNDWILSIDADEIVSENLSKKIRKIIKSSKFDGYKIRRVSYYLGKPMRYGSWRNDYPLRLFNKKKGKFNKKKVHESVQVNSKKTSLLEEEIIHYSINSIKDHISKINLYTDLNVVEKKPFKKFYTSILFALLSGLVKFLRDYILKVGFLDGKRGFILALISSFGNTIKYLKIWEEISK